MKLQADISHCFSSRLKCTAKGLWDLETLEDISAFQQWLNPDESWVILGRGSNLIPTQLYFPGVVIRLGGIFREYEADWKTGEIITGAAMPLPLLAREATSQGWAGLERLGGIPGTIGGAVVMNAGVGEQGCYSISSVVHAVEYLDLNDFQKKWITLNPSDFSYRHSPFLDRSTFITRVHLKLKQGETEALQSIFRENMDRRKLTQPLTLPNWGSTFMNPPNDYAGRLIEVCGLKGLQVNNLQVNSLHANFIVNLGEANGIEARQLIEQIIEEVFKKTGVRLQREVRYLEEEAERMKLSGLVLK